MDHRNAEDFSTERVKMKTKLSFVGTFALIVNAYCGGTLADDAAQDSKSGAADLISMARSGVDETVLQTYIETSPMPYDLSADDIVTLKDLGVSSRVIRAALLHGRDMDTASARQTVREAASDTSEASQSIVTSSATAPADSMNTSFFYDALYPYGNWVDVDGVSCWQPNAATINSDWTPYCNHGHWAYSDWGWCWVSDYSWGWAPFHYGRWMHHRNFGWCWVPGNQWGPAWVSWRSGSGYCGWAPLPPDARYVDGRGFYAGATMAGDDFEFSLTAGDYCFVPADNFYDSRPWVHTLPPTRSEEAYRNTAVVKNGYGFERGHMVNRGLPVDFVESATGRKITTVTIVAQNPAPSQPIQRTAVRGRNLTIYKPAVSARMPENPAAIKARFERAPQRILPTHSLIQREQGAVSQTISNQQTQVQQANVEKAKLENAARLETDVKKRNEIQGEAQVREMRAQQAEARVTQMKKWNPPSAPMVMPRSRVVQQQAPVNTQQVQAQTRTMIQQEAREEQRRQQVMEDMIRKPPVPQARPVQQRVERNAAPEKSTKDLKGR